jgi:hypothetical protein
MSLPPGPRQVRGLPSKRSNSARQSEHLRAARRTGTLLEEFQPPTAILHWLKIANLLP